MIGIRATIVFFGGGGHDIINGFADDDTINGGSGNDTLNGGEGNDSIVGGTGDDEIHGGQGDDTISDASGNSLIYGGDGNDHVVVGNSLPGADSSIVYGGDGGDWLDSSYGSDFLYGGDGDDVILGGHGNDYLDGGDGDDYIKGGTGNNTLVSGDGNDTLIGGGGTGSDDTFILGGGTNNVFGGFDDTIVITEMSSGHIAAGEHDIDGFPEWDGSDYNVLDLSELNECDVSEIVENGDGSGYVVFASGEVVTFEFIDEIIPPTPHDGDNGFNDSTHDDIDCIDTDLVGAKVDDTGQVGLDLWETLTAGQAVLSEQIPIETDAEEEDIEHETWF